MLNPANLPDDIDALKAKLAASLAVIADRDAIIERKEDRIVRLEKLIADFKRALFGARSEKSAPDQFELALEERAIGAPLVQAQWRVRRRLPRSMPKSEVEHKTIRGIVLPPNAVDPAKSGPAQPRNANRGSLPKHLPRIEEVIEPEASLCDCGGNLHQIGEVEEDQKTVWGTVFPTTVGTPRRDPGPVPRHRHPPSEVCLPRLLERCGAGSGSDAPDPRRHANRGNRGACAGLQIRRPFAALPAGADLQPPGH